MKNASEKAVIVFSMAIVTAKSSNCVLRILCIDHRLKFLKDGYYFLSLLGREKVNPSCTAKVINVKNEVAVAGMQEG